MKTIKEILLERKSVRRYEREAITPGQLDFIYNAIRNTPTSYNGQQFSVIDIDDSAEKEELYNITGQKQIKTCSHFFVFCADYYKINCGAKAKNLVMPPFFNTADGVIVGVVDASLAMMSAIVAAESLGLGTCPIGYLRTADPMRTAALLKLPKGVFAVCGLALGVPRETPDLKPKQPSELTFSHNTYNDENMAARILAYDSTVKKYNETRTGNKTDNDWVAHMLDYYKEAMDFHILDALRRQGFDMDH